MKPSSCKGNECDSRTECDVWRAENATPVEVGPTDLAEAMRELPSAPHSDNQDAMAEAAWWTMNARGLEDPY